MASEDAALQDTATKTLGKWMTVDAAPVLLDLASPESGCKYPDRALRGYIRLARQFAMPDDERRKEERRQGERRQGERRTNALPPRAEMRTEKRRQGERRQGERRKGPPA